MVLSSLAQYYDGDVSHDNTYTENQIRINSSAIVATAMTTAEIREVVCCARMVSSFISFFFNSC